MDKFSLSDLPKIDKASPNWFSVEKWANQELARLRAKREDPDADMRKLDVALGGIFALRMLLALPQEIQKSHDSEPVEEAGFGIPTLDTFN